MTPVETTASIELGGNTLHTVNLISSIVIGCMTCMALLGCLLDLCRRRLFANDAKGTTESRWGLAATLVCSYALLAPGLFVTLFSFNVSISIFGITKALKEDTESMVGLIGYLFSNELLVGAFLVTLYSMIIPALKVVLLILGETWRYSTSPVRVKWAGRCIAVVQGISKWACPDLFAYILMTYLFRSLNQPPHLLSGMQLDVGFACFSIFCVGSTLATLGLHGPEISTGAEKAETRCKHNHILMPIVIALAAACFVLLALGMSLPIMELRMDMELLYENKPGLKALASILDSFHVQDLMHAEVSVWKCMCSLAAWILQGEVTAAIAFVMYAVFVVSLTVADMVVLVFASWRLATPGGSFQSVIQPAIAVSRKLKKLSMLDVSIMGVVVVVMSLRNLRSKGVIISMQYGLVVMLAAEMCHYLAFHLVCNAAKTSAEETMEKTTDTTNTELAIYV